MLAEASKRYSSNLIDLLTRMLNANEKLRYSWVQVLEASGVS
jgi:hypothetical protein